MRSNNFNCYFFEGLHTIILSTLLFPLYILYEQYIFTEYMILCRYV